jgi:3',5'-cyclic AMP phosphodiesterase CpdA
MALLVQITDTHIQPKGELLYGQVDAALHLREAVAEIGRMRPVPDLVVITGDLVEKADRASYVHFIELIEPIGVPVYVLPGNHDDPVLMAEMFADTGAFPVTDETHQFAVEVNSFRLLALNSHIGGSELPEFDGAHLDWLVKELPRSKKPTMIAIHHPPMRTGIEFIDMGGTQWFQELKEVLAGQHNVHLVICGHCHTDMSGRIGNVPVYMCGSVAHQLIAARNMDIAPSFAAQAVPPVLHHFIDGQFVSGSYPWPLETEENRIDRQSGIPWDKLKKQMMGSKAP